MSKYLTKGRSLAAYVAVMVVSAIVSGFYGTADTNLTNATSQVQSYFSNNIGTVIALVVGISLFFWIVRIALRSVGVRRPRSVD